MTVTTEQFDYCERCGERLKADRIVWLELNCDTGVFHEEGTVPKDQSQGCFPFGQACAKNAINKTAHQIRARSFT